MDKRIFASLSCVPIILFGITGAQTQSNSESDADLVGPIDIHTMPDPLRPLAPHKKLTTQIVDEVKLNHFSRQKPLNDEVSEILFERYINALDERKYFFLQSDITEFEQYTKLFDDYLKNGRLDVAFDIFNRVQERQFVRFNWVLNRLEKGIDSFDLETDETLRLDREENATWLTSESEGNTLWEKILVNEIIDSMLRDPQKDPIDTLTKRYTQRLNREVQTNPEDAYSMYVNSFSTYYDPHTEYFNIRDTENFDIQMSLSLHGIGAQLQQGEDDHYIRVMELIKGCAAEKHGGVEEGDRIIGVGQRADAPIMDVQGMRLDEVVVQIRGPKGTSVFLELLSSEETQSVRKLVEIVRDECKLESSAAQKSIVDLGPDPVTGESRKIGVIDLPSMYVDFDAQGRRDSNYRSATRDVERLIEELKEEGVVGLIVDLRNNGGGSLIEANSLTGLFITIGTTVQVKNARGQVERLQDRDRKVAWSGPLAVLVNRRSASASEIFAGAIQDYGRGIILGNRTFGKGTVQQLTPLSHGKLKITRSKFYRVSGQSTQEKGVIPDIEFPELIDPRNVGESNYDEALPYDMIGGPAREPNPLISSLLPRLSKLHDERIVENPDFLYFDAVEKRIKRDRDRDELSLNLEQRELERKEFIDWRLDVHNARFVGKGIEPVETLDELNKTLKAIEEEEEENNIPDALLIESANIVNDLLDLSEEVAASPEAETTGI